MVTYRFFNPDSSAGELVLPGMAETLARIHQEEADNSAFAYELIDESGQTLHRAEIERLLAQRAIPAPEVSEPMSEEVASPPEPAPEAGA